MQPIENIERGQGQKKREGRTRSRNDIRNGNIL